MEKGELRSERTLYFYIEVKTGRRVKITAIAGSTAQK